MAFLLIQTSLHPKDAIQREEFIPSLLPARIY